MVCSRIEPQLEALEKYFNEWQWTLAEDWEVREMCWELNNARLKRIEKLLEALVRHPNGGIMLGASKNTGEKGSATKRQVRGIVKDR